MRPRLLIVLLTGLLLPLVLIPLMAAAGERTSTAVADANCRYGVANLPGLPSNQWIPTLGAGFYYNFTTGPRGPAVDPSAEFVPQVRMQQKVVSGVFQATYVITPTLTFGEEGLGTAVLRNPGRLWFVGNEPDVNSPIQDRMQPEVYAEAYHRVYHFIKQLDPTAYVTNAGLSMATPGRLQYLDKVWNTYQQRYGEPMPVDVWNMHLYVLAERDPNKDPAKGDIDADGKIAIGTDPQLAKLAPLGGIPPAIECGKEDVYCRAEHDSVDIFIEQVRAMRRWMKDHGQQNKPLILSEWSQLYPYITDDNGACVRLIDEFGGCFTPQRVITFMQQTLNSMNQTSDPELGYPADGYRLVQQWAWYSVYTVPNSTGGSSNLILDNYRDFAPGDPAALSQIGESYRAEALSESATVNLVGGRQAAIVGAVQGPGNTTVATIRAHFHNDGTVGVTTPFSVTFYSDRALTQVIGTAVVDASHADGIINGCAWGRDTDSVSVTWSGLPPGTHRYWAKIDSDNAINDETSEADNVTGGTVTVYPQANYLAFIHR